MELTSPRGRSYYNDPSTRAPRRLASQSPFRRSYASGPRRLPSYFGTSAQRVRSYGRFGVANRRAISAPELKNLDTAIAFNADTTFEVPATGQLALIPQGATEVTRVGRKCIIKTIQLKLRAAAGAGAVSVEDVDVFVIQDTQCNGAAAAVLDVFTQNTLCGNALRELSNIQRFKILKHIRLPIRAGAGVAAAFSGDESFSECFIKCNIPMEFSAAAGAIASIKTNNLFLIAGSHVGDDVVNVDGNCRIKFSDV